MSDIAILIPTLRRPHRLKSLIENIHNVTPQPHTIYFMTEDPESMSILDDEGEIFYTDNATKNWNEFTTLRENGTWPERINKLYKLTKEPYMFLGSDDSLFHPFWAAEALHTMASVNGVVTVADLHNPNGTLALVSREYIDNYSGCIDIPGVIIYPGYKHNFSDTELFNTARSRNRWAFCERSIVEHLHPHAGKSPHDEVYQMGDDWNQEDSDTYHRRTYLWENS